MMSLNKTFYIAAFCSLGIYSGFAQEKDKESELGTEVVEIVKPYSPSITDAFKIKAIPQSTDSVSGEKKTVTYEINSVPVASTFTPEKGRAANVERPKREKLFANYAKLGVGNYTNTLGEAALNFDISREENASLFFRHNSSQGNIKDAVLDDFYYDTRLDAKYANRQRDYSYDLNLGLEHQSYNWYGVPTPDFYSAEQLSDIDPLHSFFAVAAGGNITLKNTAFEGGKARLRYLGDSYSSSEIQLTLNPEFLFPIENVSLRLEADIDYLSGSFDNDFLSQQALSYGFLKAGFIPSFSFSKDNLSLSIGAAAYLGMDSENSESEFSIHPRVRANYRLDEAISLYAGAEGGLKQNSYYDIKEENPFVSPTLFIAPTKNVYKGYAGITGILQGRFGYNFRVSHGKDENRVLFKANMPVTGLANLQGYHYNNSFQVTYDDVATLAAFGEFQMNFSERLMLGVNATYFNHTTESDNPAWNLPNLTASVFSDFKITDALTGGLTLYYIGERKDEFAATFSTPEEVTLDGYADANLRFTYEINNRFSAFLNGNNLLNSQYSKWLDYPVQGIQIMVGAIYRFDWR